MMIIDLFRVAADVLKSPVKSALTQVGLIYVGFDI